MSETNNATDNRGATDKTPDAARKPADTLGKRCDCRSCKEYRSPYAVIKYALRIFLSVASVVIAFTGMMFAVAAEHPILIIAGAIIMLTAIPFVIYFLATTSLLAVPQHAPLNTNPIVKYPPLESTCPHDPYDHPRLHITNNKYGLENDETITYNIGNVLLPSLEHGSWARINIISDGKIFTEDVFIPPKQAGDGFLTIKEGGCAIKIDPNTGNLCCDCDKKEKKTFVIEIQYLYQTPATDMAYVANIDNHQQQAQLLTIQNPSLHRIVDIKEQEPITVTIWDHNTTPRQKYRKELKPCDTWIVRDYDKKASESDNLTYITHDGAHCHIFEQNTSPVSTIVLVSSYATCVTDELINGLLS